PGPPFPSINRQPFDIALKCYADQCLEDLLGFCFFAQFTMALVRPAMVYSRASIAGRIPFARMVAEVIGPTEASAIPSRCPVWSKCPAARAKLSAVEELVKVITSGLAPLLRTRRSFVLDAAGSPLSYPATTST